MRSTKIGRKILVGILCAAMVVQCVPAEAVASEIAEIVQSYDQEALDKTEPQEENVETNVELGSSELEVVQVTSEINTEEAPEEAENQICLKYQNCLRKIMPSICHRHLRKRVHPKHY